MEFTGERYVPELLSAKISYEHWHRYIFASRFCVQKTVLDVACGEGFGSAFLSNFASQVTGIDISAETINHARNKYNNQQVEFTTMNAVHLSFQNKSFDVVVSFETLEHLNKEDQELFISEIARVITTDGILLISTPNKKIYSDEANYTNAYHLAEFYKPEFETFLMNHFENVVLFNQEIIGGSLISRPKESMYNINHLQSNTDGFFPGESYFSNDGVYLIAVCSKSPLDSVCGSLLLDNKNALIKEFSKPQ